MAAFSYESLSAMEVLEEVAMSKNDEISERAQECISYFFEDYDPETNIFLQERLDEDPEL